ncbi:TPA: MmcQ/YjbR family DNA-binding protein [Morganella morganii]|nr:MmcQ/YjbR family DNA-binding protein [Morganella morganii]MCU6273314.1 MmcQ/YjbR family DNA-binding protein [Morganella morganii]
MQRSSLVEYIKNNYGSVPEHPWDKYPNYVVFRHPNNKKWFALIMDVPADKLHIGDTDTIIDIIDVKVRPELVGSLRLKDGVFPAYHMNKEHWVSVILSDSFDDGELKSMIDESYRLTQ